MSATIVGEKGLGAVNSPWHNKKEFNNIATVDFKIKDFKNVAKTLST